MVFIIVLYVGIIYLVFFKFRLLPWNKISQAISLVVGIIIVTGFLVGLRNLAPASTQAATTTRIVEIASQVGGRIDSVPAERNVTVDEGTVLFTIDPTAYQARVDDLTARLDLSRLRLGQFEELAEASAGSQFQLQQSQAEVRQLEAQLASAQFDLNNTIVRAPFRGTVPRMFLKEGMQVSPGRSVMTFLDMDELMVGGLFPQKALRNVHIGDKAMVNFPALPGRVFESKVVNMPRAIGDVQMLAAGQLPTTQEMQGTRLYPIYIELPEDFPDELDRVGLAASIYIHTERAGIVGSVAVILQKISASLDMIL
jgi:multidrug resistance efflux pump